MNFEMLKSFNNFKVVLIFAFILLHCNLEKTNRDEN